MAFGGLALRSITTFIYGLAFCCAGIILGVYSYFLAVLADRNAYISNDWKAVEGLSGAAVVYTIFALVLTCFLGGMRIFAFLGIILDVLFCGAMIAIAILLRHATNSCDAATVTTPIGSGNPNANASGFGGNFGTGDADCNVTYVPHLGLACRLNKAAFAVSIVAAFLFLVAAIFQLWTSRHAQKDKKYGPSPANNYTSGRSNKFWKRKRGPKTTKEAYGDPEMGATGATHATHATHNTNHGPGLMSDRAANRISGETGYTGTTMGGAGDAYQKTDQAGYHTGPTGTSVNPYGYQNNSGANF